MTKEELKQKLKGAMYAQRTLEGELDKLQELRSLAQKITPVYSQAPGGSGSGKVLENSVAKIVEQERVVASCCDELCEQLAEVRALVALLPVGPMRLVMQRRYLNYRKWEQIAMELDYTWQHVHRLHGRALEFMLKDVIECEGQPVL